MTELLAETDEPVTMAGALVPGSEEDRPSGQEISRDTMELNATMCQRDKSASQTTAPTSSRIHVPLRLTWDISKTDRVLGHNTSTNLREEKPYNVCSQTTVEFNQKPVSERELGNPYKLGASTTRC